MSFFRFSIFSIVALLASLILDGCSRLDEPDYRDHEYGYIQFKLYKEASYPLSKAVVPELEYLSHATKIKVTMRRGKRNIVQTMVLRSMDGDAAEFGLRSEKLQLLAGSYKVIMFTLYDKMDQPLYEGSPTSADFEVVPGGLCVHDLTAKAKERGHVRFTIIKDLSSFPEVKASKPDEYTFDEIKFISLSVRNLHSGRSIDFDYLPTTFSVHFDEEDKISSEEGYQTASLQCDTLLSIPAGEYVFTSYSTYRKKNDTALEVRAFSKDYTFEIKDNETTECDVPVALRESDAYIKDYYVLYKIWKALGGENWYYIGERFERGTNWDFNKDPDLWGDQPGVQLHSNGRVALIDLSNFGFYGEMPNELGQLTELVELYLGTHNDENVFTYVPGKTYTSASSLAERKQRAKEYLRSIHPATQFSEPVAFALKEKGISIPEIAMYEKFTEDEIIDSLNGSMLIRPMDTNPGVIINGLTKLPESIGNLKKLQKLCIANSTLSALPDSVAYLESCVDIELYNLPKMIKFPTVIAHMPAIEQINLSCNPQWGEHISEDYVRANDGQFGTQSDYGLHEIAKMDADGDGEDTDSLYRAHKTIQMIYMNECGLSELTPNISNLKNLGLLSLSYNKIDKIYPFGSDIVMVQLYMDHNKLTEIPVDHTGTFCGMDDVENLSFSNNKLELLPDIFTSQSQFIMKSVDFSNNQITGVQKNGDGGTKYKGINVETLSMTNNPIETYPVEFAESESKIAFINMRGCKLSSIPKKALDLPKKSSNFLMSLDLSYNHLTSLPESFNAVNIPHLYGLELSYNEFSKFPYEALGPYGLTVFGIRGQRNKNGERCLSEWPLNIAQHAGLRGFYIGSNNLGKIDDTISPLCYYLEVSDNPDIILDASSVCYEASIGAYYLICDKDQDIRNCPYINQ